MHKVKPNLFKESTELPHIKQHLNKYNVTSVSDIKDYQEEKDHGILQEINILV